MNSRAELLAEFAQRYVWWADDGGPSHERIIAQVMNVGTYDDICRLERAFDADARPLRDAARASGVDQRSIVGFLARPVTPARRPDNIATTAA